MITLLTYEERLLLLGSLSMISCWAILFYHHQNQVTHLGGAISPAKMAWLAYTIFVWFVLCPLLAMVSRVGQPLRLILGSFAVCIWVRGVAELYMLYIKKNWRPLFGIMHDLCSLALVIGLSLAYRWEIAVLQHPFDRWVMALIGCVVLSLWLETCYASMFQHVMPGRTTGDKGIWFVPGDDPQFLLLNRMTAVGNVFLYGFLLAFVSMCLGLW